jgi:hypothetical protein
VTPSHRGAPIPTMRDEGSGTLRNADMNVLMAECRAQIEKNHGPIVQVDNDDEE